MLQLRPILSAILAATKALLLVASFTVSTVWAQSDSLDSLPPAIQDEITLVCLPIQFRDGAGAYRDCVQSEIALRTGDGDTALTQLSFDDKYAVQQACANTGEQSSQNYKACVATQISELNQIAIPSLNKLSEDELYVVQQSCFNAQSTQGAANYRQCLNSEIESLNGIPAADTSKLSMLNKNALQLRCSSTASNAVQYRQCVTDQFESIAGTKPSFLSTLPDVQVVEVPEVEVVDQTANTSVESATDESASTITALQSNPSPAETQPNDQTASTDIATAGSEQPISDSVVVSTVPIDDIALQADSDALGEPSAASLATQPTVTNELTDQQNSSAQDARIISRPELVETLEVQEQANAQTGEPEPTDGTNPSATTTQNAPPMQKLNELWQKFLDSISSMDSIGWLLIAAVLALPALLLGLFAMIRGFRKSPPAEPEYVAPRDNRSELSLDSRRLQHEHDAATLFDDDDITSDHDAVTRIAGNNMTSDHDAVTRIASKSEQQRAPRRLSDSMHGNPPPGANTYNSGHNYAPTSNSHARQSAFSEWLLQQPESNRMEACIEFLVYWVAYGDDRYQPDLKQRLFTDTQLSSRDQIKRWVLKQDVFAFSDVIGWLKTNATQKQLDQCVALLMALLVTEHSITPVQNTVLRFLSDAFNIGRHQLEQRFDRAFGHPMPPVPRTDKYAWWTKQQPEFMQRWEARFMATRAENEQMMARLGLNANYDEAQVINAFRRAARRCHPDRFTDLGNRERALAEQQFVKFEQARDKLLGVSV